MANNTAPLIRKRGPKDAIYRTSRGKSHGVPSWCVGCKTINKDPKYLYCKTCRKSFKERLRRGRAFDLAFEYAIQKDD